ncbi:MAG: hypothetical protein ACKV2Q_14630 [Planctomycetaceae bacterium]
MKIYTSTLYLVVALVTCGCDTPRSKQSNDQNSGTKPGEPPAVANSPLPKPKGSPSAGTYAGDWSEPVNGLSARLLVTLQEGTQSSLWAGPIILEVKNADSKPIAFVSQPSFSRFHFFAFPPSPKFAVWDPNGNAPESLHKGNHLSGEPQWAVIPGNAYLGLRVDTPIPADDGLCLGSLIVPGTFSVTLVAKHREGPENQWIGEIKLPPVDLSVNGTGS